MKETIMEQLFPIHISASPGRDCKEIKLETRVSSPELNNMHGTVSPNAILNAINDDSFNNNLSEEEKAAFCKGLI